MKNPLNNRFTGVLPYPQVVLTSTGSLHLDLGTHVMDSPNVCSVVLVAGSHLHTEPSISYGQGGLPGG